jgi:cytochrome c6
VDGKALFINECAKCHGTDGKLGLVGSADLSLTKLSVEELSNVIKNGKGTMPKFDYLTEAEIAGLTDYIATLK